jgi:large subunit ribosomal protein L17
MRHRDKLWKLGRTRSHRKALLCNLATALIRHKRIVTTEAKAKALRPFVERLITKAKHAVLREQSGQLPSGWSVDLHRRRFVARFIRDKAALQELFGAVAVRVLERPGGYTRIVKLGYRRGDGARMALIELVDWAGMQEGAIRQETSQTHAQAQSS